MSQSRRFPAYPPAHKARGRNDFRLASNVSERRKWLEKHAPEWQGPEIWSEKRVKRYINDIKSRTPPLPMAKRVKIPWSWDCVRIPVFAVVVDQTEEAALYNPAPVRVSTTEERTRWIMLSMGTYLEDGAYNDFI